MGQGFAYARENNGTREVVIKDSTGKDIAMSAFSGYLAFSGNLLKEGLSHADAVVKGTLLGKAYSIVDGVVSGVLDAQGNPDKSMNDVIGTAHYAPPFFTCPFFVPFLVPRTKLASWAYLTGGRAKKEF